MIEALLVGGASTGLLGNGETALHMAALFGRTRITHLLLVNGADPLMKNKVNIIHIFGGCNHHVLLLTQDGLSSCDLAKEAQFVDLLTVLESFEDKTHMRKGRQPFTAPSSISLDVFNDDSSQCSDTTSTTDQTTGMTSILPHYSAPTPLFHKWPPSTLYPGFMPPSTEEELIDAIKSMVILVDIFMIDQIEVDIIGDGNIYALLFICLN